MHERRVVVTGMGAMTPIGHSVEQCWNAVLAGQSGIASIESFDATELPCRIAGEVKAFDPLRHMAEKEARRLDRFVQLGVAAAVEAVGDAGIDAEQTDPRRIGVLFGSGIGGLATIEANHREMLEHGPRRVSPFFIPGSIVNMIAGVISMRFGFAGANASFATACSTGSHCIGEAAEIIRRRGADVILAGGSEAAVTPLALAGFCASRAVSTRNADPERASRPWDRARDGFVLGEGAACVVLEELGHARRRGARIYGELIGFGMSADAYHMTSPPDDGRGAHAAMRAALTDAMIDSGDLDHINAHATSTPAGDRAEASAIARLLTHHRARVAVTSTKSLTGHLLGAAGALEAVFSVLALHRSCVPATANLEDPDNEFDLDLVRGSAREVRLETAMSNSFGFGGTNAALVFRRV